MVDRGRAPFGHSAYRKNPLEKEISFLLVLKPSPTTPLLSQLLSRVRRQSVLRRIGELTGPRPRYARQLGPSGTDLTLTRNAHQAPDEVGKAARPSTARQYAD